MVVNTSYDQSGSITWATTDDDGQPLTVVYNPGDVAWVLCSTALVWLMIPGVGFFYSGLLRRKNALSMIHLSMLAVAVVSFQWWFWGYSLAFSEDASVFIGNLRHFALRGVEAQRSVGSDRIPAIIFCVYQLMFAAITPILAVGAIAERGRLGPMLLFIFIWTTIVYDPIACWTWNPNGWVFKLGGLDFAGGTPVHISSGTAAFAISLYLGKRRGYGTERLAYKPHNTTYVVLGTVFLWFGWFGFNGGSALSANLRAAQACIVTNLCASVSGLTWMLWDWRLERKWSAVGFCSGAIAGLVAITPASGFVGSPASVLFGVVAGTLANFATQLKFVVGVDDCLDIFASHAVGGVIGNLMTGLFAQKRIAFYDGITEIDGGWLDHHYIQLAIQLADSVTGLAWSFVVTTIICWAMHLTPWTRLRASEDAEILGIDDAEMGEFAYDYVGLEAELLPKEQRHDGTVGGNREPMHHPHPQAEVAGSNGSVNAEK
ncbi:ammonium transporter [Auricularia subglabra TFB-10046 SS5]|nr:ammonium transporter [Auricularia subglabra TFB-10046 SS5]